MARKKQSEKSVGQMNTIDLGQSMGLTLMSEATLAHVDDWLPTMMPALDYILGGGIPFGRVTEIYGMTGSGKSTLAVHLTKVAQQFGTAVIWIDVEGTADPSNLESLGVDISSVFIYQPEDEGEEITIEAVTDKIKEICATFGPLGVPVLLIWDSLASTKAKQQQKENYNANQMGVVASAITNMTVQIGQKIGQTQIAFVILNQARDDLKANPMYPKIKSTGGRAMEHWPSLRLEVVKASQIKGKMIDPASGKEVENYIGHIFRVKTEKSKVSTPHRKAEVFLISEPYIGFDFTENVYRAACEQYGLISKGAWREYTTNSGQQIKLRDKDWVPFLNTDEGDPVLKELFQKELITYFPNGFAPLNNSRVSVDTFPYLEGMRDYYTQVALTQLTESEETE